MPAGASVEGHGSTGGGQTPLQQRRRRPLAAEQPGGAAPQDDVLDPVVRVAVGRGFDHRRCRLGDSPRRLLPAGDGVQVERGLRVSVDDEREAQHATGHRIGPRGDGLERIGRREA